MEFWQIDKVRRALHSYRALKGAGGKLRSWAKVRDDIPASDDGPDLHPESLRRFAIGENQTFEPEEKFDDIIEFLIRATVLTREELADDTPDRTDALIVRDKLANISPEVAQAHAALAPRYIAMGIMAEGEGINLTMTLDPSGTLLWAEEEYRYSLVGTSWAATSRKHEAPEAQRVFRRGYGFSVSAMPTLNFYLRGADRKDLVHYVGVDPPKAKGDENCLYFVRRGGERAEGAKFEGNNYQTLLREMNVIRLVPFEDLLKPKANDDNRIHLTPPIAERSP